MRTIGPPSANGSVSPSASAMPAGALLDGELEPVDAEVGAVAEELDERGHVLGAGDDDDLGDVGADERLDRPLHHRPPGDREEVLVRRRGERVESRAGAPGEEDAPHRSGSLLSAPQGLRMGSAALHAARPSASHVARNARGPMRDNGAR